MTHRLLLLALAAGCVSNPDQPSQGTSRAPIVGGEVDLQHTAVVDILLDGEQDCSGTLISPHLVLTAAHCIVEDTDDPSELVVFTGPDESELDGGELHEVVAGPIHPTHGTVPQDEDIGDMAVLVLAVPSAIAPMAYNRQPLTEDMIDRPVTVVGYGDTTIQVPTRGGGTRRSVTIPLVDFNRNWVMAGGGGQSQCYGDSGGPMLMELGGVERVIGIDSWSAKNDCGGVEHNTRVDLLSAWVDELVEVFVPGWDGGGGDEPDAGPGGGDGPDGGGDDDDGGDASADSGTGGCQTSGAAGGPGAWPLALLALTVLVAGRRSQRASARTSSSSSSSPASGVSVSSGWRTRSSARSAPSSEMASRWGPGGSSTTLRLRLPTGRASNRAPGSARPDRL
jgi:MYXO-CTERM domain-containing protein